MQNRPAVVPTGGQMIRPDGYTPGEGYLWDPWFVWQEDRLHLFHLLQPLPPGADRAPAIPRDRPVIAHAVWSPHTGWVRQPVALDYAGTTYDSVRIHTGSIVQHDRHWRLFYSGSNRYVCLALSDDLVTWHRSTVNPILSPEPRLYGPRWRDPWIFRDPVDARYTMLLAAQRPGPGTPEHGVVGVARSDDLVHWELEDPLDIPPWFAWLEVPELHRIQDAWYLLFATREHWITADGRAALQAQGVPARDGAFYLRADHWRGPYRLVDRLFPAESGRYTTRLVAAPNGERWLWSHIEHDAAGRPRFELAPPLVGTILPDGRLAGIVERERNGNESDG